MEVSYAAGLALLLIGLAAFVVLARDTFAALVGFVVLGLLLALAWMILRAPDVALTEAAVGGGVTGVLLLGAWAALGRERESERRPSWLLRGVVGSACLLLALGLGGLVLGLPTSPPTLAPEALALQSSLGLGNPVTAVLLGYRALDTLLEKVVLLLALVGVWSLASGSAWGGVVDLGGGAASSGPLPWLARRLIPVGFLTGFYLLWAGANHPGGAFQGGALLAAMGILGCWAGLVKFPPTASWRLRGLVAGGTVAFASAGLAGLAWGGFLSWPAGWAKPLILAVELVLTISIAFTLILLVAGPVREGGDR